MVTVTVASILRQIGALQRTGARVESITLHPDDADAIEAELAQDPKGADSLDNQLGKLLYGNGHKARFWFHGLPVFVELAQQRGTVSIAWSEA